MKNYVQEGCCLEITAAADLTSGQVVAVAEMLGVAAVDIKTGAKGNVCFEGVYTVPKVSGAVIKQGETLTWDASAAAFDDNAATPATGDITGACAVAAEDAGNGVTSFNVLFTGVPGTVH